MNKNAIQKYAIWARNELIEQVKQRAFQYGIDENGYGDENATVIAGRVLSADEKRQRRLFVDEINKSGYNQAVEEVAYTWFNRFVALRYMEVNDFLPTHIRIFSDASGNFNPEILTNVLHLDLPGLDRAKVSEYLNGNQTEELYRYLLLTQCNALNELLPEIFERMGAYTEMLIPNNILKPESVIGRLVKDIPEDDFRDAVQIIGWMYQYYNTEPKAAVFSRPGGQKIKKEEIPAATQLFTPDWIVRYMVENSLGRLWLESHPNSELRNNWKYYLDEAEQDPEVAERLQVLREENAVKSPEDIKIIDPCMGSGHILVYAFDVLMQIYTSEGYTERDAAKLILEKNLYGLEIDRRAYQLAYFALMMKAREYNRRILTVGMKPKVFYFIDSSRIAKAHIELMGSELMPVELSVCKEHVLPLLNDFRDATEFGSILNIEHSYPYDLLRRFAKSQKAGQMTISENPQNYDNIETSERDLLQIIDLAETLAQRYDVVVTNPPYMGSSGMGAKLSEFVKKYYPNSKYDLFAVFIERCGELLKLKGYQAMITQHAWMFLSSYGRLRSKLIHRDIVNMVHLGPRAFEEIGGEVVQTTAFVLSKDKVDNYDATYVRLVDYGSQDAKEEAFLLGNDRYLAKIENFEKIPGYPVSYWISDRFVQIYAQEKLLREIVDTKQGLKSSDDKRFFRFWTEVSDSKIDSSIRSINEAKLSRKKWIPLNKGGTQRWFGDNWYVINWENDGFEIKAYAKSLYKSVTRTITSMDYYFRESITWPQITSSANFRYIPAGFIFNAAGPSMFCNSEKYKWYILGLLNTKIVRALTAVLNPTVNLVVTDLLNIPFIGDERSLSVISVIVQENISLARADWDSFETSWDFKLHPLVELKEGAGYGTDMSKWNYTIKSAFENWEAICNERFTQLKSNEEELNRIFIDIYGLQDELTSDVEDKDVTVRRADLSREIRSLISYAVGCMLGRYSLNVEGLAYAGGTWNSEKYKTFSADKDNILPICDDEYFDDDITGRFVDFVKTVYGADTLEENLKFIADALSGKGTPREVIRNYFLNDFYKDHVKIYQKRPIYWLFDSGKKNGFKALIYMHRYSRDLLAKLRTDYVHEQQERYRTQLSHIASGLNTASGAERANLLKQQDKLTEQLREITTFEEKVHHLADQNIMIDLDDGVKKNYEIFADVLAKI